MVKPVDPIDPTSGDGNEKYNPPQKRGPSEFDKTLEKEKAERSRAEINRMAEEHRAKIESERPRTYTERLQDMGRLPKPSGGGGSGSGGPSADMKQIMNPRSITYKKGGKITASSRADGCAQRGKTKGRMV